MEREFFTATEVAQALGVSSGRVYQLITAGELPTVRIGNRIRIPRDAWAKWLADKKGSAGESHELAVA